MPKIGPTKKKAVFSKAKPTKKIIQPPALKTFKLRSTNCSECPMLKGGTLASDPKCMIVFRCPNPRCHTRFDSLGKSKWEVRDHECECCGKPGHIFICPVCNQPTMKIEKFVVCSNDQPLE